MASTETSHNAPILPIDVAVAPVRAAADGRPQTSPPVGPAPCPTCGTPSEANTPGDFSYVYALGQIEWRYPRISVEKEFAQAIGRIETKGKTDRQAFGDLLKRRENRYLARALCWLFTVQGLETYILQPRDPLDLDVLVDAISPETEPLINLVVGVRGPIAPPEMCNGLMIPIVGFDQIYSFAVKDLVKAIPRPTKAPKEFDAAASELFERIMQMTDNAGATDEHRALNYLAVRYPAIYAAVADANERDASLTGVEVRRSSLPGTRKVVEVIFTFTNRNTDVQAKQFVRVDVSDEYPHLITKMGPFFEH